MKAVKIRDMRENDARCLAVDLRHVLKALGPRAESSTWRIRDVWATGDAAAALDVYNEKTSLSGTTLRVYAENVVLVIDGVFSAYEANSPAPWVVVEAVDSTYYAIHSDDENVLRSLEKAFQRVSPHDEPVF